MATVGQRHVSPSHIVQHPEGIQATIDSMTPLNANQRSNLVIFVGLSYSLGSGYKGEVIRIFIDHSVDDVNLLCEQANGVLELVSAGNVC